MHDNELKDLMEFISQSCFVEFEMEREGFKLKLVKDIARVGGMSNHGSAGAAAPPSAAPAAIASAEGAPSPQAALSTPPDIFQVTSPMVGTFYRASNPNAPPFVQVGDVVKKGQVLCIIEAMKLMNEIDSEYDGEVANIYVENGQPVQYGERLFAIRTK